MKYLKPIAIALLTALFMISNVVCQEREDDLISIFVGLTKHEGWGPFSPREGFEPSYYTGTFTVAGEEYKLFQLKHSNNQYEERFMFRKVGSEITFSEQEGGVVYHRFGVIDLEGITFDIFGYRKKADQFVMMEKEDVNYVQRGLKAGVKAPQFTANSLFNESITLTDYQDKYVLLDFWGTWCGPCLKDTPYLKKAYKKFGDVVQFIGIAVDNKERLLKYLNEEKIDWPQIYIPENSKQQSPLVQKYNVYGYPTMYLISPKGEVLIGPEKQHLLHGEALAETLSKVLSNE